MRIDQPETKIVPLDDDDQIPELLHRLPDVSSGKRAATPMRYPGNPKTVLYKTEGHYMPEEDEGDKVDYRQVEELDRLFKPNGDIIGADSINYDDYRTPITRGYEKLDPVEYTNIFLDDDDTTRGNRKEWVKCYQNGFICGEPVTRHYFGNKRGTVQWDVKYYRGFSNIGGLDDA